MLLISFVFFSMLPAFIVSRRLSGIIKRLRELNGKPDGSLEKIFQKTGVLEHLWYEYSDSLHQQLDEKQPQAIRFRSTLPASVVFRPDIVVDIPLRSDFFKHLPGLFTGVGIIGTFYGLLIGMQSFVVSENPVVVRASLTRLLHGVSEAFLVSASAITLAMIVTFVEKLVVSSLNAKVEKLIQLLDGLFEGGAGEEYLARLVRASEASAGQSLLKGDLKEMLTELSEKQIAANNAGVAALGEQISRSIEVGLKGPLSEIAQALKATHDEPALQTMLSGMFDNFNRQMKELFGGQANDMNSLQKQTIDALSATVARLEAMATEAGAAGQRSMEAIAEQLGRSSAAAESRQALMNEKLAEFIGQMREAASQTQSESKGQLQQSLSELSVRMGALIDGLGTQVRSVTDVSRQNQLEMEQQGKQMVSQFGGQIEAVVEGVTEAVAEMKSAVTVMQATTKDALSALGGSADTLYLASQDFARAGQLVNATMEKSAAVANQLLEAAETVSTAASGLGDLFADYKTSRDAMIAQMQTLQLLAEQVRRDASMSGEVFEKIESATGKLVAAQMDADQYLSRISDVIGLAHQSFSDGMTRAVGEANREFHQALSDSVKLLREGIHELESTLDAATNV
ncbi:MAG: hypothetical protein A2522_07160 [Gallionellales bacterium RIFOXYD12_FULL_53_10]|nr:MAG: hypothetical protein A2Z87_09830 [Gallionellales bacterium GWA2_54_124]OGT18504.1 MAG: hypothetical protein A2522_07160 [Gallionellales bacterium RIFOXYD12_FULL_53_10]